MYRYILYEYFLKRIEFNQEKLKLFIHIHNNSLFHHLVTQVRYHFMYGQILIKNNEHDKFDK
jgi:hypothetical protein